MSPWRFRFATQCRQKQTEALDDETEAHQRKTCALPRQQRAFCGKQYAWIGWIGHYAPFASLMELALASSACAMRMLAMSISRPSSDTAPRPSFAACAIASMMRLALVTSACEGVYTRFASSICEGWIAHLPS